MRIITAVVFALIIHGCLPNVPEYKSKTSVVSSESCVPHWSSASFPIQVLVYEYVGEDYKAATEEAVFAWNDLVGANILYVAYTENLDAVYEPSPDIISVSESMLIDPLFGEAHNHYNSDGVISSAEIFLDPSIPGYAQLPVMFHEIGHAFGLIHDKDPISVMFPLIHATLCQTVQTEDVEAVREQTLP